MLNNHSSAVIIWSYFALAFFSFMQWQQKTKIRMSDKTRKWEKLFSSLFQPICELNLSATFYWAPVFDITVFRTGTCVRLLLLKETCNCILINIVILLPSFIRDAHSCSDIVQEVKLKRVIFQADPASCCCCGQPISCI